MEETLPRREHEEFARRMEEAHHRQDKRLANLEEEVRHLTALTTAVEKLATNMGHMAREQEQQGKRLAALEERDGAKWRQMLGYIASAAIGGVVVYLLKAVGLG